MCPEKKDMKHLLTTIFIAVCCTANIFAQLPKSISYEDAMNLRPMIWSCPDYNKCIGQLDSMKNDDWKIFANNVKEKYGLVTFSNNISQMIGTSTKILVENPYYNDDVLLDHISAWLKKSKLDNKIVIDKNKKNIKVFPLVKVAEHSTFFDFYRILVHQTIGILIDENRNLSVYIWGNKFEARTCYSSNQSHILSYPLITEVYPFNKKASNKITYAKAYVGSYLYNWDFIRSLQEELNNNFKMDDKSLTEMRYKYSRDSLCAKYGEPETVITGIGRKYDIDKEMYFFEKAEKIVFLGDTFDFNDIISCQIKDDPTIIPGSTSMIGAGICIFGFGIGGGESYKSPDKTIHNYVVNIKIDNLKTPYIRIALGRNEYIANQISSTFDYIFRHRKEKTPKTTVRKTNTSRKVNRK